MTADEKNILLDKLPMQFGYTTPQHQESSTSETTTTSVSNKTTPSTSAPSTSCALRKKIGKQTRELQRRHSDGEGRPEATRNLQMDLDREDMQSPTQDEGHQHFANTALDPMDARTSTCSTSRRRGRRSNDKMLNPLCPLDGLPGAAHGPRPKQSREPHHEPEHAPGHLGEQHAEADGVHHREDEVWRPPFSRRPSAASRTSTPPWRPWSPVMNDYGLWKQEQRQRSARGKQQEKARHNPRRRGPQRGEGGWQQDCLILGT